MQETNNSTLIKKVEIWLYVFKEILSESIVVKNANVQKFVYSVYCMIYRSPFTVVMDSLKDLKYNCLDLYII